jgi:hypothetical protein
MMSAVTEPKDDPVELPPPAGVGKLGRYGAAWHEATEIAEACRIRLRNAVLEEIDAGMAAPEAGRRAGISRVTVHTWMRARRREQDDGPR